MELSLEIDPETFNKEALMGAIGRLAEIAPDCEPLRVIVAVDFEAAVRERVADADYAANYKQERMFGRAMAKTITQEDGSIDLVVDAGLVHGDLPQLLGLERLLAHEAYHILTDRNGEQLNKWPIRLAPPGFRVRPAPGLGFYGWLLCSALNENGHEATSTPLTYHRAW